MVMVLWLVLMHLIGMRMQPVVLYWSRRGIHIRCLHEQCCLCLWDMLGVPGGDCGLRAREMGGELL